MKITYNKAKTHNGITLINYANQRYSSAQEKNTKSAIKIGGFEKVISFDETDIDEDFRNRNNAILKYKRGGGYWLWKPYFIQKALKDLQDGDLLFYCDSGSVFIKPLNEFLKSVNQSFDFIPFELQTIEKHWTKRDCLKLMECDYEAISESKQRLASFSFWKKTPLTLQFVSDWLTYAMDERILTDLDNTLGHANYVGFVEHRHDQSIFSLLSKRNNITGYCDPSQFGNEFRFLYPNSKYSQFLSSTRQMNISWFEYCKKKVRPYFSDQSRKIYRNKVKVFLKLK